MLVKQPCAVITPDEEGIRVEVARRRFDPAKTARIRLAIIPEPPITGPHRHPPVFNARTAFHPANCLIRDFWSKPAEYFSIGYPFRRHLSGIQNCCDGGRSVRR